MLKNKLKCCDASKVWHVIFIIWIVFASLYVIYGEYNRLSNVVAKGAYNSGVSAAVGQLMNEAAKCQPFPVTLDGNKVTLMNLECAVPEEATE